LFFVNFQNLEKSPIFMKILLLIFFDTPIENIARKSPNLTKISQYYREYNIYDNIAKFSRYYSEILAIFFNRDILQFNSEFWQYYSKILAIFFNRDFAMK
jgi:hypothetical protein